MKRTHIIIALALVAAIVAIVFWGGMFDGATSGTGTSETATSSGAAPPQTRPTPKKRAIAFGAAEAQRIDLAEAERVDADGIGRIEGRVLSRGDDSAVAGATLSFDDGTLHRVTADRQGKFSFLPPREGVYALALVEAAGFLPFAPAYGHSPMVFAARRGAGLRGARVYLTPAVDYTVSVVSVVGKAVAGAQVAVLSGHAQGSRLSSEPDPVATDEAGKATLNAPDGAVLEATHPEHGPGRARLDFSAQVSKALTIELSDKGTSKGQATIAGTVKSEDGKVADALLVAVFEADNPAQSRAAMVPNAQATSDEDGHFAIEGLEPGKYVVYASASGYAPSRLRDVVAPESRAVLVLKRGAGLRGKVSDADTGAPIGAFVIVVREKVGPLRQEVLVAEPTFDPLGNYDIPSLPAGTFSVTASAHGYAPSSTEVTISDDAEASADIALSRGGTVSGLVVDADDKTPIAGAKVSLEGNFGGRRSVQIYATASTDENGRFTLRGVTSGSQYVMIAAADHHAKLINITLEPGGSIDIDVALSATKDGEEPRIEMAGIGAVLSIKEAGLIIGRVVEGGGALEAGLASGDVITHVDHVPVVELGFSGSIKKIRGPEGSEVLLRVIKAGSDSASDVVVIRRVIRS